VDADQHLSPAEEEEIYRYYKMNYSGTDTDRTAGYTDTDRDRAGRDDRYAADTDRNAVPATGTAGAGYADTDRDRDLTDRDRDLTDRDNGVTRHEERLHVGKEKVATGRARLRKYVVTDTETVEVPVQREEVRVERTPLSGNESVSDRAIGEEDVEVTLHEERPVVAKETVAVERVGLEKDAVTDSERVNAEVRKEQVDVENDVDRGLTDRDRTDRDRNDRI
jgi:uncharacterized protein (TIGR02271 family)